MRIKLKDFKKFINGFPDDSELEVVCIKFYIREDKKFPLIVTFDEELMKKEQVENCNYKLGG